jgi:hypothetical protein
LRNQPTGESHFQDALTQPGRSLQAGGDVRFCDVDDGLLLLDFGQGCLLLF